MSMARKTQVSMKAAAGSAEQAFVESAPKATQATKGKETRLNVVISPDQLRGLKIMAAEKDTTIKDIVSGLIDKALTKK